MQIAEVAEKYKLTPDTLRYYERIGLLPTVTRTKGGIREYSEEDERWVEFMTCMRPGSPNSRLPSTGSTPRSTGMTKVSP